jgi:hypothetical protein
MWNDMRKDVSEREQVAALLPRIVGLRKVLQLRQRRAQRLMRLERRQERCQRTGLRGMLRPESFGFGQSAAPGSCRAQQKPGGSAPSIQRAWRVIRQRCAAIPSVKYLAERFTLGEGGGMS